jgi:hypothetical protein
VTVSGWALGVAVGEVFFSQVKKRKEKKRKTKEP